MKSQRRGRRSYGAAGEKFALPAGDCRREPAVLALIDGSDAVNLQRCNAESRILGLNDNVVPRFELHPRPNDGLVYLTALTWPNKIPFLLSHRPHNTKHQQYDRWEAPSNVRSSLASRQLLQAKCKCTTDNPTNHRIPTTPWTR